VYFQTDYIIKIPTVFYRIVNIFLRQKVAERRAGEREKRRKSGVFQFQGDFDLFVRILTIAHETAVLNPGRAQETSKD